MDSYDPGSDFRQSTYYASAFRSRFVISLDGTCRAWEIKLRRIRALRRLMIEELFYNR
jgi:hypothetical protein